MRAYPTTLINNGEKKKRIKEPEKAQRKTPSLRRNFQQNQPRTIHKNNKISRRS